MQEDTEFAVSLATETVLEREEKKEDTITKQGEPPPLQPFALFPSPFGGPVTSGGVAFQSGLPAKP